MNRENSIKTKGQETFRILPKKILSLPPNMLTPVTTLFVNLNINPNALTVVALLAGMGVGVLFYFEKLLWAGILIIVCGLFDIIDGKVAEQANKTTLYGAIFDSTLDRYSEFFIYLGIAVYFKDHWALWLVFWTFLGSTMVSYTRAKAEGLGIECKTGFMQRAERMVFLATGTIIGSLLNVFNYAMIAVLFAIALFSNLTAIQRTLLVKKVEKLRKSQKEV